MKGFRFRLETLARLRSAALAQERRELEHHCSVCDAVQADVDRAAAQVQRAGMESHRRLAAGALASEARSADGAVTRSLAEERDARATLAGAERRVTEARARVVAAWRESRILDRLRERARDAHRRESARRRQRELDEIASRRPSRSLGEVD